MNGQGGQRQYPAVPTWPNHPGPWLIGQTAISLVAGSMQLMMRIDTQWSAYEDPDPSSQSWRAWHLAGAERTERFVLVDDTNMPLAAWLDRRGPLKLQRGQAYRVDFAMVRPDWRRRGLGKTLVQALKARARHLSAARVVFLATPTSYCYWRRQQGAVHCTDWDIPCQDPRLRLELSV